EDNMADIIINYLEGGGFVYLEGGGSFHHQKENEEFLELFGVDSSIFPAFNPINLLEGQADALTGDLVFTSTSQQAFDWVGSYAPNESGIIAFEESDYGTVAVQNTGVYDQRTFCSSYTLADLDDGEFPNTREELLRRISHFFDIYTDVYSPVEEIFEFEVYPNPTKSESIISYYLEEESVVSIDIFDVTGKLVNSLVNRVQPKGNKHQLLDISSFPEGIYFLRLDSGNETVTKKIIKVR
ncbi:MAG: T9SS type A sorting domain-containing protein, partial [Bacteroidales bacterium]|nr:T9SS type A sorting domain-containing protein [Bacteroidales bacterium]